LEIVTIEICIISLFGATMGQGVVWYTGQFYAMNFMKTVMSIDLSQVDTIRIALIMEPIFIFFLVG
jgi:hypothetical protein